MRCRMRFVGYKDGTLIKGAPGNYKQGKIYIQPCRMSKFPFWELVEPITPKAHTPQIPRIYGAPPKPDKPIHILYVASTTRIGGGEIALKRLIENLDPLYYRVEILITDDRGPLDAEYRANSDIVDYLDGQDLETVLTRTALTGRYDYLHFYNLFKIYDMLPALKKVAPSLRIVSSIMVNPEMFRGVWKQQYDIIRKNEGYLYAQIVDSAVAKELFPHSTMIKNGVNLETFIPASVKKPRTVAWIGRISTAKKAILIPQIAQRLPDYSFKMVGGEKTEEYYEIVNTEGLKSPENLEIQVGLDERQIADTLAETQYMIFTSYGDSLPISVLEAMAAGCCVVAEQVGDIPKLIQDGVNGYLIPRDTNPVVWVHTHLPKLDPAVGEAARRTIVSEHDIDYTVKQHEFLYGAIGSHRNQTRIAFLWDYQASYASRYWDTKIDSLQNAIMNLSKHNVVQLYIPIDEPSRREIINGQNIVFMNKDTDNMIQMLRHYNPHMIFLNLFHAQLWPRVIDSFPGAWIAVIHYGAQNLRIPYAHKLDAVLVQMEYLRSRVAEANNMPIEKVLQLPFCVEDQLFKPRPITKEYTGVMIADFRADIKRPSLLIEAWRHIPGKLLLLGRFDRSIPQGHHQTCMGLAKRLGVADRIIFMDGAPRETIPELINKAKIGFLTSSHEGGSRALKEMLACGIPCVVLSDCAGNVNMIVDGVDGLVADPTPESIAEKAAQLLGNYSTMGAAASKRIRETYPYDRMYNIFKQIVMDARPEVSIITTSMNRGKYIGDCIVSVQAQRGAKVNHIIMDSGSTDETLDILEKHRRILYSYVRRDAGQTDAIIRAVNIIMEQHPQTSYIGWVNADDYYTKQWMELCLAEYRKASPDTAVVCADAYHVHADGSPWEQLKYIADRNITLPHLCMRGNIIIQPTVMINVTALKKLREKTGRGFDPDHHYCQDLELWTRFLRNGFKVAKLEAGTFTAYLRSHPDQMSRTHMEQQIVERDRILRGISEELKLPNPGWVRG